METIAFLLMGLVCFSFVLKQTFYPTYFRLAGGLVICAFIVLACPYAIEQSRTQIADWMADTGLMLDIAVILTVDILLQIAFCMQDVRLKHTEHKNWRKRITYLLLRYFPGIMIFPVLFYLLVTAVFAFPGSSFEEIAWGVGLLIALLVVGGSWGISLLLPEKELRLELLFLTHALTGLLGIVATVNGKTAAKGVTEINWPAFGGFIVLLLLGALVGICYRKYKMKKLLQVKK